jgi:2-dehydropantoate 2-reductase
MQTVKVLIVGAGVIGTVYGAHLASGGHSVFVLRHGRRTDEIAGAGLAATDVLNGIQVRSPVNVVASASPDQYDVVIVTVRREQLTATFGDLRSLEGHPALVFFGNNPGGRAAVPPDLPGEVFLGFPGIGGSMADGVAEYVRIPQQPTSFETTADRRLIEIMETLRRRGFAVHLEKDMDGWLVYHALFVSCVSAALYRCGTDPARLAGNRPTLELMCRAVTDGFSVLRMQGVGGLPRNLGVLHSPLLRPIASRYWARTMRSPMGELCFAAHARHAEVEMRLLGEDVMEKIGTLPDAGAVRALLEPA